MRAGFCFRSNRLYGRRTFGAGAIQAYETNFVKAAKVGKFVEAFLNDPASVPVCAVRFQ